MSATKRPIIAFWTMAGLFCDSCGRRIPCAHLDLCTTCDQGK